MGKKHKKLNLDQAAPAHSLNDAFASLDLEGLPEGPDIIEPAEVTTTPQTTQSGKRGEVILRRETAHRGGKTVIIVQGLASLESEDSMNDMAARLKKRCGCGGTIKDGEIIIQGEKAPEVAEFLRDEGFRVRGVTQ